jgi:hypothetical protein
VQTAIISLNRVNQLIFLMAKSGVLFEVRSEFLNVIYASFGFKGLSIYTQKKYTHTHTKTQILATDRAGK